MKVSIGGLLAAGLSFAKVANALDHSRSAVDDHSKGLLLGSLIGDALGVPIEFQPTVDLTEFMPNARDWPDEQRLTDERKVALANRLRVLPTAPYRPTAEPFGVWSDAPALGSLSDDSRMKIILIRAIRSANSHQRSLQPADIAREFMRFEPHVDRSPSKQVQELIAENLSEYRIASKAVLSKTDRSTTGESIPGDRIWGGVDNCSGQMMFPPLSVLDAGEPEKAYHRCYEMNFIDTPAAKDIIASINSGLAALLDSETLALPARTRWQHLLRTMRTTDPYGFADVPFVGRRLHHWMDLAKSIAKRADGRPATAYRLLESEGKPVFYWDAHFTLLVPLTLLHLCDFDSLAAMHLCLDFGHDTDSYAQILGAMIGAVHGFEMFPDTLRATVEQRLLEDYGESIDAWADALDESRQH